MTPFEYQNNRPDLTDTNSAFWTAYRAFNTKKGTTANGMELLISNTEHFKLGKSSHELHSKILRILQHQPGGKFCYICKCFFILHVLCTCKVDRNFRIMPYFLGNQDGGRLLLLDKYPKHWDCHSV